MIKTGKRIAAILATACICVSLTACANNEGFERKYTIDNPWWSTTGELRKEDNNVVFDDVDVNLTTVVTGADYVGFKALVDTFNSEYRDKIHINISQLNDEGFEKTMATNIINNSNAPDLIMSHQKGHAALVEQKIIQPFDEAMEKSGIKLDLNDYSASLTQYSSLGYEGYLFSLPIDVRSEVVYYNKTLLGTNELPTNRSELIELCNTVKEGKGSDFIPIATKTAESAQFPEGKYFALYTFPTAIVQNGGHLYNDSFYADWADDADNLEAFKDAVTSIKDLVGQGLMQYNMGGDALNKFLSNQALFYVGVPWELKSVIKAYGDKHSLSEDKVISDYLGGTSLAGWFALDKNADAEYANRIFGDSHCFAMSKTVTNINKKAAILEFMKWYTQTVSTGTAWAEAGHMSASTIVTTDSAYTENTYVANFINNFYSDINQIECMGISPYFEEINRGLGSLFASMQSISGANKIEAAIRTAQDDVNEEISFAEM